MQPSQKTASSPIYPVLVHTTHNICWLFLNTLYRDIIPENERGLTGDHLNKHVVVCNNERFHYSDVVRQGFAAHDRMLVEYLPPYSPFLNPIEEFFSSWRWKVYDWHPHTQMALLVAMDAACDDITAESCRGWIRHSRRYFPRCIARDNIRCDVDETMWPDREESLDVHKWFTVLCMFSSNMYCNIVYSCAQLYPKGVYVCCKYRCIYSFAQCCEQIRIAKSICSKNVKHTYSVSCTQIPH